MHRRPLRFLTIGLLAGSALLISACSDSDDMADPTDDSMPSPTIDSVPQIRIIPAIGSVYTSNQDLTLYTRYSDTPGTVNCDSTCEQTWPPLTTDVSTMGISGQFDVIERTDSTFQWTLDGYPLYLYSGDAAADEANGDGVDDAWAVARPLPITSADVLGDEALVSSSSTLDNGTSDARLDRTGHTLYFFSQDESGTSNCAGACAIDWPPLLADKGAVDRGRYTLISRANDSNQWSYDGRALYFYLGDTEPSQATGDGLGGFWSVARP